MFKFDMSQEFDAPVSSLFDAWCKVEVIKCWFAPGDMSVPEASVDLKENGLYRIVMQETNGEQHIIGGTYKEIKLNEKLVFTWQWEGSPFITTVTVLFHKITDNRSSLTLIHEEFEDQDACDKHKHGWNGCLANLDKTL